MSQGEEHIIASISPRFSNTLDSLHTPASEEFSFNSAWCELDSSFRIDYLEQPFLGAQVCSNAKLSCPESILRLYSSNPVTLRRNMSLTPTQDWNILEVESVWEWFGWFYHLVGGFKLVAKSLSNFYIVPNRLENNSYVNKTIQNRQRVLGVSFWTCPVSQFCSIGLGQQGTSLRRAARFPDSSCQGLSCDTFLVCVKLCPFLWWVSDFFGAQWFTTDMSRCFFLDLRQRHRERHHLSRGKFPCSPNGNTTNLRLSTSWLWVQPSTSVGLSSAWDQKLAWDMLQQESQNLQYFRLESMSHLMLWH